MTTRLEIIYWRDIPAQVIARSGRIVHRCALSDRFQEAIDRAAQSAGSTDADAYLTEWRKKRMEVDGDPADVVRETVQATEEAFSDEALAAYAANRAWKP
jgi:hypothetical protein